MSSHVAAPPLPTASAPADPARVNPSNRFGIDYEREASRFADPMKLIGAPIIDAHTHIHGRRAAELFRRACDLYGIGTVYSQTTYDQVETVRQVLGDRVRFIAIPDWRASDRVRAHGPGYLERIRQFHALGAKVVKFWAAPRGIDMGRDAGNRDIMRLDFSARIEAMELAASLGMIIMTHVADPDTWFATKYSNAAVYGRKLDHYKPLEALLDRFANTKWIAAHMGGYPEDLAFLSDLLRRHPNLHLDTSAAKWMIRELSRHPARASSGASQPGLIDFLEEFRGRILFGSDIVTMDEHLSPAENKLEIAAKADSEGGAFDLYASRYWALRMLWETSYEGESPIADPDLAMVDPARHSPTDAPPLRGFALQRDQLRVLYHDAAAALLEGAERRGERTGQGRD